MSNEAIKPTGDGAISERQEPCFTPGASNTQVLKVQYADCLVWLSPEMNHTCRQQVRRNQRSVAK